MSTPSKAAPIPTARAAHTLRTPPGILGFAHFLTPDGTFDPDDPVFNGRIHLSEAAQAKFASDIDAKVIGPLLPKLQAEVDKRAEAAGTTAKKLKAPTGAGWLEDKLQEPKKDARIQLPSVQLKRAATFVAKKGEDAGKVITRKLNFWDKDGNILDGAALKTGMGSLVQLVYTPGLFTNAQSKGYAEITLRLEGVIVLKNEPWGRSGAAGDAGENDYSDEDLAEMLGGEVELDDDLSAFAGGASRPVDRASEDPGVKEAATEYDLAEEPGYDLNDDIPF